MKIRRHVRVFLLGLAVLAGVTGCQTQGGSKPGSSAPQSAAEKRISQDFYLPFYDQADHLKSLMDDNNLTDADRLYVEQKAFFDEHHKQQLATLQTLATKLNAKQNQGLKSASQQFTANLWPAPPARWHDVRTSLELVQNIVKNYPAKGLLADPEFRDKRVAVISDKLTRLTSRIKTDAVQQLAKYDVFGASVFFDTYPVELNSADVMENAYSSLRNRLFEADASQLEHFAANYPKSLLGKDNWTEISSRYLKVLLGKSKHSPPELADVLKAVKTAGKHGFKAKSVPGLRIGFIEVTSKTLLTQGAIDFPASVNIDLPVEPSKVSLDKAFDEQQAKQFDYLIIFDVAVAKASRRVLKLTPIESTLLAGYRDIDNPEYAMAQQNVEIEKINFNQAAISAAGYHGEGFAALLSQYSANSNRNNAKHRLELSMQALSTTPKTIQKPVYQKYTFNKATLDSRKAMTVHFYVIDQRRKTYFKSTFDINEKERFNVAYDINREDVKRDKIINSYATEGDVDEFEKRPSSVKVSQLIRQYIAQQSQSRKLQNLTVLRTEMLSDKNTALAKYKANSFDARPLNDPRFDSVVVVYAGKFMGTGFFVKPDIVLTNWHVVEEMKFVEMKTYDGQETFGKVLGKDVRLDLALIKVQARGKPVKFYTNNTIDLGATVEAIGHPEGHEFSISRGVVSAVRKEFSINLPSGAGQKVLYVQSDVAINHGNSGGPMFLGDQVVGVNTWGESKLKAEGLNFAVHYSEVLSFLKEHLPGFRVLTN